MTESGANSNNENTMNAETRLQLAALLRSALLDTEKYERTVGQSGTGFDVRSKRFKEPIELVYLVLSKFKYILLAAVYLLIVSFAGIVERCRNGRNYGNINGKSISRKQHLEYFAS